MSKNFSFPVAISLISTAFIFDNIFIVKFQQTKHFSMFFRLLRIEYTKALV